MSAPIVWDAHADTLLRVLVDDADLSVDSSAQGGFDKWRAGGVNVQVFAVWVDTVFVPYHAVRRALQQIDALYRVLERHPDRIALARTAADIREITGSGRLAALLAIEGGAAIQDDLGVLRMYNRLGATSMTLTHSATTTWCDSSTDTPRWNGLSDFGRVVVREMNRLRMLVDVSHISDDAVRAVLDVSSAPVIASHSSAWALCDHPRNLKDDLLRAIAQRGGVIGVNFFAGFLDADFRRGYEAELGDLLSHLNANREADPARLDEIAAERQRTFYRPFTTPRPAFDRILDHIDHIAQVTGIEHVGIGADLDSGPIPTPTGLDSFADYPRIGDGLAKRGYSDTDIARVMGGNFMRVFEQVVG